MGLSYRLNDALAILAGAQVGPLKFGYSYDFTLSDIGEYSAGYHEVFIEFQIGSKNAQNNIQLKEIEFIHLVMNKISVVLFFLFSSFYGVAQLRIMPIIILTDMNMPRHIKLTKRLALIK